MLLRARATAVALLVTVCMPFAGPLEALGQARCTEARQVSVPCEGTLLPDAWAADGLACLSAQLPECLAQKSLAEKLNDIEKLGLNKQLLIAQELNKSLVISISKITVPSPPEIPWHEHKLTYLVVGGLIGIGTGALVAVLSR